MKKLLLKLLASDDRHFQTGVFFLRVFAGLMMLFAHGWGKLTSIDVLQRTFPDPLGMGRGLSLGLILFAEIFCSCLLLLGCLTRLAVLPLMFAMIVAFFVVHSGEPFQVRELPVLYFGMYAFFLWTGGGRYAVDEWIRRKFIRREPLR